MYILKETYALKEQGIEVKHYPQDTFEEYRAECWQKEYEWHKWYDKNFDYSESEMNDRATKWADEHADRKARNTYDADVLYIKYGERQIAKKVPVKSKEITAQMVLDYVEKDKKAFSGEYGNFARAMEQLLKKNGIGRNFCIYPTTYGIGVWVFYNFNADKDIERVNKILDEQGIEYYNEYSDAQWVWRYKISKAQKNLLKVA